MTRFMHATRAEGTRRHSQSAYVRQVNFFTAFIEGWEGDGAALKPSVYLVPFSK